MFKNYQEVSSEEGFDKVIEQDNIEELKKVIGEIKESKTNLKFLRKFESFIKKNKS